MVPRIRSAISIAKQSAKETRRRLAFSVPAPCQTPGARFASSVTPNTRKVRYRLQRFVATGSPVEIIEDLAQIERMSIALGLGIEQCFRHEISARLVP